MPTLKSKVEQYERFLHLLQLNAEVAMNPENVKKLIGRACNWSYAHRVGNGELTEKEQNAIIDRALENLTNLD